MGGNSAAVHAALRNARTKAASGKLDFEGLDQFIVEPPAASLERMEAIEAVLQDIEKSMMFSRETRGQSGSAVSCAQVKGMIALVEARIRRSTAYRRLAGTFLFFLCFFVVLYLQQHVKQSHEVESSIINMIVEKLPTMGQGGFQNTGPGSVGFLSSSQDFYDWMDKAFISQMFTDPVCGDGVCDSPEEYAGFGRFGCSRDCGPYLQTTTITIELKDVLAMSASELGWDLSSNPVLQSAQKSDFKYNIYSHTMSDFLFEADISNSSVTIEVPDGEFELVLYQTGITASATEISNAQNRFGIVGSTVPVRSALTDFEYGTEREALAQASLFATAIERYCSTTPHGMADAKCSVNTLDSADFGWKMLGAYGFNGKITMKQEGDATGTQLDTLAAVNFCSVVPQRSGGIHSPENKKFAVKSAMDCPENQRRSSHGEITQAVYVVRHINNLNAELPDQPERQPLSAETTVRDRLMMQGSDSAQLLNEMRRRISDLKQVNQDYDVLRGDLDLVLDPRLKADGGLAPRSRRLLATQGPSSSPSPSSGGTKPGANRTSTSSLAATPAPAPPPSVTGTPASGGANSGGSGSPNSSPSPSSGGTNPGANGTSTSSLALTPAPAPSPGVTGTPASGGANSGGSGSPNSSPSPSSGGTQANAGGGAGSSSAPLTPATAIFKQLDLDGSGKVNVEELKAMFGGSSKTVEQMMAPHDLDGNKELDYAEFVRLSSTLPDGGGGSNRLLKSAPTVQQLGEKIDDKGSPKWLILALTFQPPPNYQPSNYAYLLTETQTAGTTGGPPSSAIGGQNPGSVSQPSCTDGPFTNGTLILSQVASYSRHLPTLFV